MPYSDRLRYLRFPILEHQRRDDLIYTYKYISSIYQVKNPIFMTFARMKQRSDFFSERVVADWDSLPDRAVTALSVSLSKACLDTHWKNLQSIFKLVSL